MIGKNQAEFLTEVEQLLAENDIDAAERLLQSISAQRENSETLNVLSKIRTQQGRLVEATKLLAKAVKLKPEQPQVLFSLGKLLAVLGQHHRAAIIFIEVVRLRPDFPEAWLLLGNVQHHLGQLGAAKESYRKVLSLAPSHGVAKLALGAVLLHEHQAAEAEPLLRQGLETADSSSVKTGEYNLSIAQRTLGKKEEALASLNRLQRLDPNRTDLDITRAQLLEELQRFDEALTLTKLALSREPLNPFIHAVYNDLLYRLGRDTDFLKSYDEAPAIPILQLSKGSFLLAAKHYEDAYATYVDVLKIEPHNSEAASGAAAALGHLGRPNEGVVLLERILEQHPKKSALLLALAKAALQNRDPERAANLAQRRLEDVPYDQLCLAVLGTAWRLLKNKRVEQLNDYERFIGIFDLAPPAGVSDIATFNEELRNLLGNEHPRTREYITQSARGGTQTRGNLFDTDNKTISLLRSQFSEAMHRYIGKLKAEEGHPFLSRLSSSYSYAGSWSSLLHDQGFHLNHIHPAGWISSCYYVSVPDAIDDQQAKEGWIKFGEPGLPLGLSMEHAVEPVAGRLILFPSYFWHGTIPFRSGGNSRLTVAFDAVPR